MDRARQVYDEMQAAGLHFAQPPQGGAPLPGESPRFPGHLEPFARKHKQARALSQPPPCFWCCVPAAARLMWHRPHPVPICWLVAPCWLACLHVGHTSSACVKMCCSLVTL
jgi:hypothetical protein